MKLEQFDPRRTLEQAAAGIGGDGWRRRIVLQKGGAWFLRLAAVVVVLAAGAWAYWANFGPGAKQAMDMSMRVTSGATPFPVTLAPVGRGPVKGTVVYTGSVAPFNEEDIYPRVTGRIVEMAVYPGDAVRAGQVVARLDDVELASRVLEAVAMAATALANRAQMEADVVAAQHGIVQMDKELAMVEAEVTYARAVAARSERLVGSGAISRQEWENDRSMAVALEAKREAARAKLEQARAMELSARRKLEAAEAMVAQGQAALRTATVVRDYVTIVAPSSGYVVKRLVAPGVLVQPGMAILKLAQIDRVRLQANVGEKDVVSIRVGSPVTVTLAGAGQAPIAARVTSVFPFVDQGPRTAVVEAVVDNPGRRFLPGQYVQMEFVTGERAEALTVPRGAVARMGGKATVWVVKDGRAEPYQVTTGLEGPERIEIARGLTGAERVIARGHDGLYAGARVVDVPGAKPAAADTPTQKTMPEKPASPEAPKDKAEPGMPGMRH
ncbi:MAG: efflux RND transporter periplasmic adaptor subunit [candidate division NC10 bacterium]